MKKFLYATLAVAALAFAACSKTDEQPVVKKLLKSTSTKKVATNQDASYTNSYLYNSDGFLTEETNTTLNLSTNETTVTSNLYNYTPNLLTLQFKDKDGKITSTLLCHLNKKNLLTVDSTDDSNAYFYEYDSKDRVIKMENIDQITKKTNYIYTYIFQGDKLTERKNVYMDANNDSKDETVTTYFYDKDIKNSLTNAARGMSFNGGGNLYVPTRTIAVTSTYAISTGKPKSTNQTETEYSYELDANGLIGKKGTKTKNGTNPWSEEKFISYEYEK